jgi:DNA-binding LytR/AlgR family response regulator
MIDRSRAARRRRRYRAHRGRGQLRAITRRCEILAAPLEARLDPEQFARISRSSIVNLVAVRELRPMFNGDFVAILRDGTQIPGSRRYRAALDRLLAC